MTKRKRSIHTFVFYDKQTGAPIMSGQVFLPALLPDGEKFRVEVDPAADIMKLSVDGSAGGGLLDGRIAFSQSSVETGKARDPMTRRASRETPIPWHTPDPFQALGALATFFAEKIGADVRITIDKPTPRLHPIGKPPARPRRGAKP